MSYSYTIVPKFNGLVRVCGNYRVTVNAHAINDKYHLLRNEKLFGFLAYLI